jgi:peptidoglycan/xylan/chitin deacetylase (PgdA/CDA1 family)
VKTVLKQAAGATLMGTGLWRAYLHLGPKRRAGGAAIVTFHRLVDDATPYLFKGPTVQTHVRLFEQVVANLARTYQIVSLDEIAERLNAGEPFPRDSVAVVFDDGYEDNHRLGLPILRRYGIRATVFLATGFIGSAERMWADVVEQALLTTRAESMDPAALGLEEGGEPLPLRTPEDRARANLALGRPIKALEGERLRDVLDRLEQALEVDPRQYARTMLTWDEVRDLADAGWEIGSHGVSHTIMTRMHAADAVAELEASKRSIEAELGRPVRHFAFPNGQACDFDAGLTKACRRIGYATVSSCVWGLNVPGRDDPYALKRVGVGGGFPKALISLERLFRATAAEVGA